MILREIIIYLTVYVGLLTLSYYVLSLLAKKENLEDIPIGKLPFVSIIIPAFNEEKTIYNTIKSAENLDYPKDKIEILVVNDGSRDRTYQVAKSYKSSRVRVFTKENGGKASAMNYAIPRAHGNLVSPVPASVIDNKNFNLIFRIIQILS